MPPVSRGVGWNQSLCYWRCPGALLLFVSGVWIKCPCLVPPSRLRFNFRPITGSPCADTPAAANAYLLFSSLLPIICFSIVWKWDLSLTCSVLNSLVFAALHVSNSNSSRSNKIFNHIAVVQPTRKINTSAAACLLCRVAGCSLSLWHDLQLNRHTGLYFITGKREIRVVTRHL